jgi:hypothetical protein
MGEFRRTDLPGPRSALPKGGSASAAARTDQPRKSSIMTKPTSFTCALVALLGLAPFALHAQNTPAPAADTPPTFGAARGDNELMIGGGGGTNKEFDSSFGGVNLSYGRYLTDGGLEAGVRQSIDYTNPDNGSQRWNGSTRLFLDQNLAMTGRWRPYLGVNLGRIYGESVSDTWAAGLEGGVKYYVMPRTFVSAGIEYGWYFQHSDAIDNSFDDGQWNWTVGVGFNF